MDAKIYIQLTPTDETRARLSEISEVLAKSVRGIPVRPEKWHITILHFGAAEHVFHDLRRDLPNLSRSKFDDNLTKYIESAQKTLPSPAVLNVAGLSIFGINNSVLVLELEASDQIIKTHKIALQDLVVFLKNCGIENTENFMRSSINFRWALELRPHITLFRGVKNADLRSLEFDRSPMSFNAGELHGIRN